MKHLVSFTGTLLLSSILAVSLFAQSVSASSGYRSENRSNFLFASNDGVAHTIGSVQWYESDGIDKGEYTNSPVVFAAKHVCIWAQVTWIEPDKTISFPFSITLSTKEVKDQRVVHCPMPGHRFPEQISLKGHVYAKRGLIATKLDIWTSPTKADGPLNRWTKTIPFNHKGDI